MYKRINEFNEDDAKSNFAADKPIPKEGFGGKLMCGFAKYPKQIKKNGQPMWHCPYKFAFSYYALKNENGEILKTKLEDTFSPKEGETVEKMHYKGCPKHQSYDLLDDFA